MLPPSSSGRRRPARTRGGGRAYEPHDGERDAFLWAVDGDEFLEACVPSELRDLVDVAEDLELPDAASDGSDTEGSGSAGGQDEGAPGDASSADAATLSEGPTPGEAFEEDVSPENILRVLKGCISLTELMRRVPGLSVNQRWEVFMGPYDINNLLGDIYCVQGSSLKVECRTHRHAKGTPKCNMHIDIRGLFEAAQCDLIMWAVSGLACDQDQHAKTARECQHAWASSAKTGK